MPTYTCRAKPAALNGCNRCTNPTCDGSDCRPEVKRAEACTGGKVYRFRRYANHWDESEREDRHSFRRNHD